VKFADLHIHTNFSDGTFSPQEVVCLAKEKGLSCIAITDHDTIDALGAATNAALSLDIEILPGIELTCQLNVTEIHILGYLIDYNQAWLKEMLGQRHKVRSRRIQTMVDKLKALGLKLEVSDVLDIAGTSAALSRLHLARALVSKGLVSSVEEAFYRYLGEGCPAYVAGFRLTPKEAIGVISRAGGIPVLAHPYSLGDDSVIEHLKSCGLKGMEVYYPQHSSGHIERYRNIANRLNLLMTGGSDCHGHAKEKVLMGTVKVPYELVERLKNSAAHHF
jgi:hypothetical protein